MPCLAAAQHQQDTAEYQSHRAHEYDAINALAAASGAAQW